MRFMQQIAFLWSAVASESGSLPAKKNAIFMQKCVQTLKKCLWNNYFPTFHLEVANPVSPPPPP
jgi:hypothetical protein